MATQRQEPPPETRLPETRRAVSYALRALEVMANLSTPDFLRTAAVLQRLVEVEIARRNAPLPIIDD